MSNRNGLLSLNYVTNLTRAALLWSSRTKCS